MNTTASSNSRAAGPQPLAPPDERFWKRYSPHGEFPMSSIASVASFFVSRVDTETDRRLDKIGTPQAAALRGKAAIANARLAYQRYEEMIAAVAIDASLHGIHQHTALAGCFAHAPGKI